MFFYKEGSKVDNFTNEHNYSKTDTSRLKNCRVRQEDQNTQDQSNTLSESNPKRISEFEEMIFLLG